MTIASCSPGRAGRIVICHNNQKGGSGNGMEGQEKFAGWAVHFPGNLRWSNAMQIVKGMAPYGAIAMEEVDRIARHLAARAAEADLDRAWREEWSAMAERVASVADKAAADGREITAGHHYMRAGNYY